MRCDPERPSRDRLVIDLSFAGDWFAYVAFVSVVQDIGVASILVTRIHVDQTLAAFLMTLRSGCCPNPHPTG